MCIVVAQAYIVSRRSIKSHQTLDESQDKDSVPNHERLARLVEE